MTKKTIEQCIPEAKRMYNRAEAKVKICMKEKGYVMCLICPEYIPCPLRASMYQMLSNYEELNRKANEQGREVEEG